ncbi:MAG: glycosyltransferase family 39 protein [Bacteroidota bacterium]|nr:glycosyltransferase family 39 protein [Bacteroidota bacterium]
MHISKNTVSPYRLCLVIGIILVGMVLRFWNYTNIPYTHDEISAILRTNYNSISQLIQQGVLPDGHPLLIQVFLYFWVKLFGSAEWVVKLPFTLCGVGALIYVFLVCKKLFSFSASVVILSFMAILKPMVMYSQIARPYITGVFFVCAALYYMVKIFQSNDISKKDAFFFVFFMLLSALNHHISFLASLIMAFVFICGYKTENKTILRKFIVLVFISCLLYLPNIPITLAQLRLQGLSWLSKPDIFFLFNFLKYLFPYAYFTVPIIILLCLFLYKKEYRQERLRTRVSVISICIFLLNFIIPYLYSIIVSPIIQYSTLLFSLPFLLFFCFGMIRDLSIKITYLLVCLILCIGIVSLVYEHDYYSQYYESIYKKIPQNMLSSTKTYKNITLLQNDNDRKIKFYADRLKINVKHEDIAKHTTSPYEIVNFIKNNKQEYLYFGSLSYENAIWEAVISDYYPYVSEVNNYQRGSTKVFAKHKGKGFENVSVSYSRPLFINKDTITLDNKEYSPAVDIDLRKWNIGKNDFIDIMCEIDTTSYNALLVAECKMMLRKHWQGQSLNNFPQQEDKWTKIYLSIKLSDLPIYQFSPLTLKTYIWNKEKENIKIRNFQVRLRKGNPIVYNI